MESQLKSASVSTFIFKFLCWEDLMKTQRAQSSDHGLDDVEFESRQEQEIFVSKASRPL
jgi:hypothetical protein